MILVDTSVLIGFIKGHENGKVFLFEKVLSQDIPFGITAVTYQELLQGARNEAELKTLRDYLSTQTIYYPSSDLSSYNKAAEIFFTLRRSGVTVSTLDCLIAAVAIQNDLALLHNDNDFDAIAKIIPELRILHTLL